ncbi:hypothetical protein Nepgr_033791 [Nepenthes gracilis]|uniref:Uncharacterized protein n=1 Tax=Nepenthes gracilis TaxID=150966 RepID=A0AAD3Y6W6_NEPGR|nr:hypothetical protein Nepgr_033791 [Nepenthes gracilis]
MYLLGLKWQSLLCRFLWNAILVMLRGFAGFYLRVGYPPLDDDVPLALSEGDTWPVAPGFEVEWCWFADGCWQHQAPYLKLPGSAA